MNEIEPSQEKDFRILINQMTIFSKTRDKQITEIDDLLDHLKRNRKPSVSDEIEKEASSTVEQPDVVTQLKTLIHKMDLANERLQAIGNRINELV